MQHLNPLSPGNCSKYIIIHSKSTGYKYLLAHFEFLFCRPLNSLYIGRLISIFKDNIRSSWQIIGIGANFSHLRIIGLY